MNIKLFEYINSDGDTVLFPFRVGDIVKIKDWGWSYTSYKEAFKHFTSSTNTPYYSSFLSSKEANEARKCASEFKIIAIAEHSDNRTDVLAYVRDRIGRGQVIGLEGLRLVKQMPLRIGEKTIIKLKKIKKKDNI